ncbi:MAG TPA: 3'-5' exonuclease [Saprospiraceae bacterium]|nr:3'-5' exonuclease [Saprospiraceae bacterium]HND88274.1 3'-5' exonuclease [Saprospiraceae bacterium]HNG89940.1 3'-5' exonuclease [Saprospiraceae bacterium]
MTLNLDRDIVFFDVETTGLNVIRDRIVQLAMVKLRKKGGPPEEFCTLINPGIPISEESMAIHGITPKDLANKPTFRQLAQKIWDFIGDADLAGYNSNRFDVPMLMEEFARVEMEFDVSKRRLLDVQRIFYKMEPRTLKAAYRFYCQQELTDAHDALADVRATMDVLYGQIAMYEGKDLLEEDGTVVPAPIRNDVQALYDFTNDLNFLDATQKLKVQMDGTVVFNFGKYAGQPVLEVLKKERNYGYWILEREFSSQVKQIIKGMMKEAGV